MLRLPASQLPAELGLFHHNLMLTFHRQLHNTQWDEWWDVQFVKPREPPQEVRILVVSPEVMGGFLGFGQSISQLVWWASTSQSSLWLDACCAAMCPTCRAGSWWRTWRTS